MNESDFRILSLHTKIERNTKLSKQLKVLAGVCLFFSFCYCVGGKNLVNIEENQVVLTNFVWIISMIVLIAIYMKDSYCVKNNKAYELEIYRLEVEDLNNKKENAKIGRMVSADYVLNRQIDMPNEEVSLPIIYYSILLGMDIIIRISGLWPV